MRAAIAGDEHHDFTEGSLTRAIILLAIPMVLEMCMESLFGIVNVFWVARLGSNALAAVALTEAMLALVFAVAMGISMATTAMIARRIGEKDAGGASVAAFQSIALGFFLAAAIAIPGFLFAPQLLSAMGAEQAVIQAGAGYTRWILGNALSILLLFIMNAIFRGAGDAAIAMRVLWFGNAVNMVLDPLLIFGLGPIPALGVEGAGIATVIGRSSAVAYQVWVFLGSRSRIRLERRHMRIDLTVMGRLFGVSATGMLQYLVATASWVGLVRIVAMFSSAALAGYTIAIRIIVFSILPSWGLANAAATLVGQNLGARKPERAESAVWRTALYNMYFLGAIGLIFIAVPGLLVRIFTNEPEVVRYGVACLRIISYGYLFYAYGMVTVQAFNGAGDTRTPTWINLGCYWLFQIPMAWLLAKGMGFGAHGAFWAIPLAESALAAAGIWAFRLGRWKQQVI